MNVYTVMVISYDCIELLENWELNFYLQLPNFLFLKVKHRNYI